MDARQSRLIEDLAGIFRGEILCDPISRSLYATDGSLHQITPLGIACPRDREDLQTLVRYAGENQIPVVARGAGTSVGGEALGAGLVVDFSRHMHAVEEIGAETVRVQPGVVHSRLNRALRAQGRYFPPDPSNSETTTLGSMLALDAAGSHSLSIGSTRDHVVNLDVVSADGILFTASQEYVPAAPTDISSSASSSPPRNELQQNESQPDESARFKQGLIRRLTTILHQNAKLIQEKQPPKQVRNRAGYQLRDVLVGSQLALPRLLVGSEGTLGLFTAAVLRTAVLPTNRCVLLIGFESVESALHAVQSMLPHQPTACDLVDRRLLTLARYLDPRFASLIPAATETGLIVEQTGCSPSDLTQRVRELTREIQSLPDAGQILLEATTEEEIEFLWSLPQRMIPLLNRARGETCPVPIVEDIAVPPEGLLEFITRARRVWQGHELTVSLYAHAAVGQVHLRPFLRAPYQGPMLEELARELYEVAISVGGSISGEHGLGLSRTAFLQTQSGELYRVFQQIKSLFDPHHLLNPGKVLSLDPHLTVRHLRPQIELPGPLVELQLNWSPQEFAATATSCHGCGACRTQETHTRMCPFFRTETAEERSPRAKANAMRAIVDGRLPPHELASSDLQGLSRLCFQCKQCQVDCPTEVNIPQLMLEAKAQFVAANGPRTAEWFLTRVHDWSDLLGRLSWLVNPLLKQRGVRWLLERVVGVSHQRKLPPFARQTFLKTAPREWLAPPESLRNPVPVIYFVDHFANSHDPELGLALGRILMHNGRKLHVPPGQVRSGMGLISTGDLEPARRLARQNLRVLAEFAREGCPIVCTEPAAVVCLKQEYPRLIDHPDVQLVADQVIEAGAYLEGLHQQNQLRTDFAPLGFSAFYHTPCHLRALGRTTPLVDLCRLIPDLQISSVDQGCSGFAGTFGFTREHFEESLAMGKGLIEQMQSNQIHFGLTECSSCKLQMEQQATAPTLHPLKIIAFAYGLMPEIHRRLPPGGQKRLNDKLSARL